MIKKKKKEVNYIALRRRRRRRSLYLPTRHYYGRHVNDFTLRMLTFIIIIIIAKFNLLCEKEKTNNDSLTMFLLN